MYCVVSRHNLFAMIRLRFVFMETESAGVLADDLDIGPAQAFKSLAGHLAETWREIDDICFISLCQ